MKAPFEIDPDGVYTPAIISERLGLTKGTLPREIRLRRLRVSKRAGRYFLLGVWVLEWLRGGEVRRAGAATDSNTTSSRTSPGQSAATPATTTPETSSR